MDFVNALKKIGHPVAYYPIISKAVGSTNAGVFLSQMMYWEGKQENDQGWIRKPFMEISNELGLTRHELDNVRKRLKELKIIEESKMGVPCKIHYRFHWSVVNQLITDFMEGKKKEVMKQPSLLFRMKEVFDKYHKQYFPEHDGYEWRTKDWKFIKELGEIFRKRVLVRFKLKEDELEAIENHIIESWEMFLKMIPQWYKDNHFFPSSLTSNFSAIIQAITTENKNGQPNTTQRKGFADVAKTGN